MSVELVWFVITLCTAGAIAGITAGLFGNGGGFVVVPALLAVFPFFTQPSDSLVKVAIGTSLASIVVSSFRSLLAHKKRGAVDFEVLKSWSLWLVLGVFGGVLITQYTSNTELMMIFALGVLAYSLYFLFPDLIVRSKFELSMPTGFNRATLAFVLGGFSTLLGIGGGTPTVITMVLCKRTMRQAVATATGVGCLIGLPGAIGFLLMQPPPGDALPYGTVGYINMPALFAVSLGAILTAPLGASMAHSFSDLKLKRFFGFYLITVSAVMLFKVIT